jgi:ankyrin repeat protein
MAMLLLFSPLLPAAFGLLIWAGVLTAAHVRKREPLGLKCLFAAFCGLFLLDIPICIYIILSAGLGHSVDASEVAGTKCLLSFVLVVVAPSAALLIVRYHRIQAYLNPDDLRKAASRTKQILLVTALGLIAACLWLFAAAGGWPPLLYASRNRYESVATFLIRHGININTTDRFGWTPLALYSARAQLPMVKLLVDRGADVNIEGKKGSPLIWATLTGSEDIAALLLQKGANANSSLYGRTPLMYAASRGKADMVRLLIEHGADVNKNSPQGSALLHAVESKDFQTVEYLLEKGANPNTYSGSGRSPLVVAASDGSREIVNALLQKGANPNESYDRKTARQIALDGGHTEVARLIEEFASR